MGSKKKYKRSIKKYAETYGYFIQKNWWTIHLIWLWHFTYGNDTKQMKCRSKIHLVLSSVSWEHNGVAPVRYVNSDDIIHNNIECHRTCLIDTRQQNWLSNSWCDSHCLCHTLQRIVISFKYYYYVPYYAMIRNRT